MPAKRPAEVMAVEFGLLLSTGTVAGVRERVHQELELFEEQIKEHLTYAPVAHADKTGVQVTGSLI